jgi:transcriptional regulator with XRE-family HTH domain
MEPQETKLGVVIRRPVKLSESLGSLIRTQGFTGNQKKIAEDIGVSEAALSHYLTGRSSPSFDKLLALADYFDVSLDYLVYGASTTSQAQPLPEGYITRQVQSALNEADRQSARRQDLISRLSGVMITSLESAVDEIVRQPVRDESARTITNEDAIALEESARQAQIMSGLSSQDDKTGRHSGTTIVTAEGQVKPGPFLGVQSTNIKRGVTYRQIVQGPREEWKGRVTRLRASLRGAGVTQEQLDANHAARGSDEPILGTVILLWITPEQIQSPQARILHERFRHYFREDGLFVYISIMDDLFKGGFPLAARYRDAAEEIFERMWRNGAPI